MEDRVHDDDDCAERSQRRLDAPQEETIQKEDYDDATRSMPFQRWLQNHRPKKATLLERITYAQELFLEAEDPDRTTYVDPRAIQRQLRTTPLRDKLDTSKGISVNWFLDVFCQTPFIRLLMETGCELWFLRNVGVNEMLRRLNILSGPFADHVETYHASLPSTTYREQQQQQPLTNDTATVFVSYTGRYLLRNYVELMKEFLRGEYMWMDIFCVDQFAWTGQKDSEQVRKFSDQLVQNLPEQIKAIDRVVLLLERWDDVPRTLLQSWELWEVFNTVQVGTGFTVLLSRDEMTKYFTCIANGDIDNVQKALADIRCQDATSEDRYVQESILEKIKDRFYFVNCKVIEAVRQWYQQKGMEHVASLDNTASEDRLRYVFNFAILLKDQGKMKEAEPLHLETLQTQQRLLGDDHPNTLSAKSNYAILLRSLGKLLEAEPLHLDVLTARQRLLGSDHPDTHTALNNYALLLHDQGKLTEAGSLYLEVLEARRRLLGDKHPYTLVAVNNYANLLSDRGKLAEAEQLYREAMEAYHELQGDDHPNTLASINNHASLLKRQGKLTEAESLYQKALEARRRLLGDDHPDTLASINNYANVLRDQGKMTEAEQLYLEALGARRRLLGDEHPNTLSTISNYASFLTDQGKVTEAEPLYLEALEAQRRLLGDDHRDTLLSINGYANLLSDQGKMTEAEPWHQAALEARRRLLGQDHTDTLVSVFNYALFLTDVGRLAEAAPLLEEAYLGMLKTMGVDHPLTIRCAVARHRLEQRVPTTVSHGTGPSFVYGEPDADPTTLLDSE